MSLLWTLARYLTRFHIMACYTNCFNRVIDDTTLQWLKRFLEKRRQSVALEGELSHSVPVTSGVPQGSLLGLLMFLIFINNLLCYVKSRVRLFADDTVKSEIHSERDCRLFQDDLHCLEKWESDWCMQFNPSKCNAIRLTRMQTSTFQTSVQTASQGPRNC